MQVKTAVRHYLMSFSMAVFKKIRMSIGKDVEKSEPCALLVGMETAATTKKNQNRTTI